MTMNPFGIIKGFNILEYQTICLLIIAYFKTVQPFPFDKRMKRFDACIIPWKSLFRITALHFFSSFPICTGYILAASVTVDDEWLLGVPSGFRFIDAINHTGYF